MSLPVLAARIAGSSYITCVLHRARAKDAHVLLLFFLYIRVQCLASNNVNVLAANQRFLKAHS